MRPLIRSAHVGTSPSEGFVLFQGLSVNFKTEQLSCISEANVMKVIGCSNLIARCIGQFIRDCVITIANFVRIAQLVQYGQALTLSIPLFLSFHCAFRRGWCRHALFICVSFLSLQSRALSRGVQSRTTINQPESDTHHNGICWLDVTGYPCKWGCVVGHSVHTDTDCLGTFCTSSSSSQIHLLKKRPDCTKQW